MKDNKVNLLAESFEYPTKNERAEISKTISKIKRLKLDYKPAILKIIDENQIEQAIRIEDVYWWNNCLDNRIGKLTETYFYVITHFKRFENDESLMTDKILFDYYLEIFYYFFFSTRDVLAQLLNKLFDLEFEQNKIYFNEKFISKISNQKIQNYLRVFVDKTSESYDKRNAFNHRFTPNQKDNRASTNIIKNENTVTFYYTEEIDIKEYIVEIEKLQNSFAELMNELSTELESEYYGK